MTHEIRFTDIDVIGAYEELMGEIEHTDAPSELELARVRKRMGRGCEMISLHWLRNRIVQLRKGGKLKKQHDR